MATTRKCAICGKHVTSGYLFDGTTCLCSEDCATTFFDNDKGCVEILIDEGDRLKWHDELPQREHFRVNIGHFSPGCFHHFDNEQTMFRWISEKVGVEIKSYDDCEAWTRQQDDEHGSYIEILCVGDLKDFYTFRRAYLLKVRECQDYMEKAQRLPRSPRRDFYLEKFNHAYDDANWYWMAYPEVWQGEI